MGCRVELREREREFTTKQNKIKTTWEKDSLIKRVTIFTAFPTVCHGSKMITESQYHYTGTQYRSYYRSPPSLCQSVGTMSGSGCQSSHVHRRQVRRGPLRIGGATLRVMTMMSAAVITRRCRLARPLFPPSPPPSFLLIFLLPPFPPQLPPHSPPPTPPLCLHFILRPH
jgi:hypothetical protein